MLHRRRSAHRRGEGREEGININHVFKAFESKDGAKNQGWVDFELDKSLKEKCDCYELKLHKVRTDGADVTISLLFRHPGKPGKTVRRGSEDCPPEVPAG